MIFHTIRFSFRPDAPQDKIDAAMANLRLQGEVIGSVKSFAVGPHVGEGFDAGATFLIEDIAGYEEYMLHPTHRKTDELGLPLVQDMVSFDIVDDADPDIEAKIKKIHADRFAGDRELLGLIEGLGSYEGSVAGHSGAAGTGR
ncbi:Dabb family protein [Kineococcus sp. NUM-3379]